MNKLLAVVLIISLNIFANSQDFLMPKNLNSPKMSEKEDIRKEISNLIQRFASLGFTLEEIKKAGEITIEISEKFGMEAVPFLLEGMKDKNERVRSHSLGTTAVIIGEYRKRQNISNEIDMTQFLFPGNERSVMLEISNAAFNATEDSSSEVRQAAIYLLYILRAQKAIPVFEKGIKDSDKGVRFFASIGLEGMGLLQRDNMLEILVQKKLESPEDYIQFLSADKYGMDILAERKLKHFGKQAIPALLEVASSAKEPGRQRAIKLLGEMKAEESVPVLGEKFKREPNDTSSLYALAHIGTPEAIDILVQYGLKHKDANVKMNTAKALLPEHRNTAIPFLKELAKHKDGKVRLETGRILVEQKEQAGISVLIELLGNPIHAGNARIMLEEVTKQNFGRLPPVVSKKMVDDYVNKWKNWWEENKDTFKFPDN